MSYEKPDYEQSPSLRTIAMPADANANGDIFGGWMLSQMDLAGSLLAIQKARSRVATVGIEAMSFERPVFVGDEVSCYCKIARIGRTSITIEIESWARGRLDETARKVTTGKFTYVAINENRQPTPIIRENS
jgi:acyl-CoA thioesterase YciA